MASSNRYPDDYSDGEIREMAIYCKVVKALPNLGVAEAVALTRGSLRAKWEEKTRGKVNKLIYSFLAKMESYGYEGETITITRVTDQHCHLYYDVDTDSVGRRHGEGQLLPPGCIKVT